MEEPDPQLESLPSSSSFDAAATTTTTGDVDPPPPSSPSTSHVQEENNRNYENQQNDHHGHQRQEQESSTTTVSYRVNISISDTSNALGIRDDVWSCLVMLVTFWLFASMTLILGFYGSVNLQLGPNCSRLIQANTFFVQSIKAEELGEAKPGPMLYGFYKPPPLDVKINWTEKHNTSAPANFHKEWTYFLNNGSSIDVIYQVKSPSSRPLLLIIAKGSESLVEWIENPPYPNTTLSWNIIQGSGRIQQDISESSNYYIAVGNLNTEEVEVELEFTIKAIIYNTTNAYYKCSLGNHICSLKLSLLGTNAAVLTSPGHIEDTPDVNWYIKLSYGTRWLTYFIGSGMMAVLIVLAFKSCNIFQNTGQNRTGFQAGDVPSERTPLLLPKEDDVSSWGSAYDSASYEEDNPEDSKAECSLEGKPVNEGENNTTNPRRLCIICFDATRDCFFLPCGHCAACFTCGTRIAEGAGSCPICRRKMKQVRRIFTV